MKSPLHILHLEDDPNDAALVQSTLKAGGIGCEIIRVDCQDAFVAALEQGGIDLILSDFTLPAFDGMSAMEIARAKCPNVPFIFVSGTIGEEQAIESLKNGATDYVLKERLARLVPAIHRVMLEVEALSKQHRLEEEVRENEVKFRTLFEVAKDAIFLLHKGLFVDCNASGLELFGVTREQLIGQTPTDFSPPTQPDGRDSREKSSEIIQGALAGEPQYFEWMHQRPDGTVVDVEISIGRFELRGEPYLQSIAHDITDRKRKATALAETSDLLETILENTTDHIYFKDLQSRFVHSSRANAQNVHVTDPAELYGKTDFDLFTREHAHTAFEDEQKIMREGKPILNLEERETHLDGTVTWVLTSKVPWRDKEGKIIGTWGISRDITERKRAEAALVETSDLLETILNNTSDHIYFKDLQSRFVRTSRANALHAHATDPAELRGKTDFDLFTREHAQAAFDDEQKIIREGKPILNVEEKATHLDGTVSWVLTSKVPWRDKEGKIIGTWGISKDITERKRTEAVLVETSELLETLLNNTSDHIYFKDLQSRVVRFSHQYTLHAHVSDPAEMYGKTDFDFYTREHAQPAFDDEQKIIREGRPILNLQEKETHLDGTVTWVLTSKVPWRDKEGKIIGTWGISKDITEAKRAEAALIETSDLLETLLKNTSDHIYFKDLAGHTVRCSQECLRYVGLSDETEMQGKTDFDFYGHEVALRAFEDEQKIMLKGKPIVNLEERQTRIDGSVSWVLTSKTPWRDKEGKIIGIWGISKDITERKRTEARFRRLVDSNAQGVIFWNTKGEITGANDSFLNLVDYTREEMEAGNINWTAMTPPEFADLDRRSLEEIAAKGVTAPYEKEFIRKDGVRVPILIGAAIFEDNPDEGVAFVLNLTDHKRATEQIVEQAALLDEAQDAILVRDLEGKIIFWNKGAERLYGWASQEVIGRDIGEFLTTDGKTFEEITALTIKQGKWSGERQHHTRDRREITIEARWTLIRDHQGRPKSILAINTDITEKKKIEAQFMRAQRMESIGTLAGGIAHDLNNILAPIMMSIDILKTTADDPETKEILNAIEVSAKRGADIVRQVLSFARGLEGERIEVQPIHLVKDLENIIKDTFPKNIRLQFSVPANTWTILGDPTQVHQILLNLSVNARDAMPNGGHLTIRVENSVLDEHYAAMNTHATPGRYVCIKVIDSGTGIPQDILDKIFEPFFTTKELNKGTGLGLSTVMAIVKSHDGILQVDSVPGKGTTFEVYLPAMELSSEESKHQTQPINTPRGKGETVLVVDDEASILTITSQTLQAFGYRVLTAADGAEAVAIYAEHKNEISIVITDMMMPLMDGAATIHALKRINPAVKIIAASGHNANAGEAKASGAGVKHFLTKPFTAKTLLKTIRAILDEA